MIRLLRRRHRVTMGVLALTVPVLFAAGLLARRPMPRMTLPEVLAAPAFDPDDVLARQLKNTGSGLALSVTTLKPKADSQQRRVAVQLLSDPRRPELLVYWSESRQINPTGPGARPDAPISEDSFLLGALSGTEQVVFSLPAAAPDHGTLQFYSLAQGEFVDALVLRPPALRGEE